MRDVSSMLDDLAHRVERLTVHRDPARFSEDKNEIADDLRRLASDRIIAPVLCGSCLINHEMVRQREARAPATSKLAYRLGYPPR